MYVHTKKFLQWKTSSLEVIRNNKRFFFPFSQLIVENILRQYNKRLDERQMSMLLEKEGSANPLWLTLACEELRVYGVFNKMDEKIASLSDDLIR